MARNHYGCESGMGQLLILLLHPFNGLSFQDILGKPAPER